MLDLSSISVVIPCHNGAMYLHAAVESAIQQSKDIEVIIVDDHSEDNSRKIAASFGTRVVLLESPDHGAPVARNTGWKSSNRPFIKFLDADDILVSGSLAQELEFSLSGTSTNRQIGCGYAILVSNNLEKVGTREFQPNAKLSRIAQYVRNGPLTSCPLHPRQALVDVGGFNETLPRGQESDLHFRQALAGWDFIPLAHASYKYRQHTSNANITSGGFSRFGATYPRQYIENWVRLCESHFAGQIPQDVKDELAKKLWEAGRGILREGHRVEAYEYFQRARELSSNPVVGSRLYRCLQHSFGPIGSEAVLSRLKSFSR